MRRVAVVDDHRVVGDLFALVLQEQPDLELVGRAASARECLGLAADWAADVVVMDVRLGDGDGVALARELTDRDPALCVIVLTAHVEGDLLHRATQARACALLPKDGDLAAVLTAVREVRPEQRGLIDVHHDLARRLVEPATESAPAPLTAREQEVLRLLAAGMDVRQVSRETGTPVASCRDHVAGIMTKLCARTQIEAVTTAIRHGLLTAGVE